MLRFLPAIVLAAWAAAAAMGVRDDGAALIVLAVITVFVLVEIRESIDRHFGSRR
jgi:hypothetical protein